MSGIKNGQQLPQVLPGTLYLVATPIGNLGDFSPRAQAVLSQVNVILCEDTRETLRLVRHFGWESRLERLDEHATQATIDHWMQKIRDEKISVAVVSDAGTPGVSDPGAALVRALRSEQMPVIAVPGPSAVTALVSISGLCSSDFAFLGFFPRDSKATTAVLDEIEKALGLIRNFGFFESPHRILATLRALAERWPEAQMTIAKELTKIYEYSWSGQVLDLEREIQAHVASQGEKGEWAFFVSVPEKYIAVVEDSSSTEWQRALRLLVESGVSTAECAKRVSQEFAVERDVAYRKAIEFKK